MNESRLFRYVLAHIMAWGGILIPAATLAAQELDGGIRLANYSTLPQDGVPQEESVSNDFRLLKARLTELEKDVQNLRSANPGTQQELAKESAEKLEEQSAAIDKRLATLEKSVGEIDGRFGNLVTNGYSGATLQFEGRIHYDYWAFPEAETPIFAFEGGNPQDRFAFRRLRWGVSGDVADNNFYKLDLEFAELQSIGIRDAYVGTKDLPFFNTVLLGNHKRPYGLDHLNSSKNNVFLERPMIIEGNNQDARRLGLSSNGFTKDQKFNWRYGVWNMRNIQSIGSYIGDHYQLEAAGRIAATPWYDETSGGRGYLHLAMSGSVGYPNGLNAAQNEARYATRPEARSSGRWLDTGRIAGADTTMLGGLEAVLNLGPTQIVGEYQRVNVDRLAGIGPDLQFHGGYFYVSHFLTGEHMPWKRDMGVLGRVKPFENFFSVRRCDQSVARGMGAWQVATRYSYADYNDLDILGGQASNWTNALNWYWNPSMHWQLNYIVGELDRAAAVKSDYQIVGLRMVIDF